MSDAGADNVIPLTPRSPDTDWTPGERARLAELTERLAAKGAQVEVVYGMSDAQDPWCVITDTAGNVLLHVARINGKVVVHDAADDAVRAEDSLWAAFDRMLGAAWREGRDGGVVPLHQIETLLALVLGVTFAMDVRKPAPAGADGHDAARAPDPPTPHNNDAEASVASFGATAHRSDAPQDSLPNPRPPATVAQAIVAAALEFGPSPGVGSAAASPASASPTGATFPGSSGSPMPSSPLPSPPTPPDRGLTLAGGPGNDVIVGGPHGDHLLGGAGDDTLVGGGAGKGEADLLDGGLGDDRIFLGERVVAIGGEGHNVFVVTAPVNPAAPGTTSSHGGGEPSPARLPVNGGVILDFTDEDRLEFAASAHPVIVSQTPDADVLAGLHGLPGFAGLPVTPGVDIGIDLNGDGHADVVILVAGPAASSLAQGGMPGALSSGSPTASSSTPPPHQDPSHQPDPLSQGMPPGHFLLG
jgi:hypothetical protein